VDEEAVGDDLPCQHLPRDAQSDWFRYNEMLFMIDTCQANTLYKHFYSPNIIATGSSEIDQSSYSHHADNDVGVAVIDRWTYYVLDYLESQVTSPTSKLTLGNLFDSYDESKIHSRPGVRWDLFPGTNQSIKEERGRERLVMDFFGNAQGVEVEGSGGTESEWREDMRRLEEIVDRARARNNGTEPRDNEAPVEEVLVQGSDLTRGRMADAAKVEAGEAWSQRILGAGALLGCALLWGGVSWLESSR